jgi:hypothetical protein
MFPIIPAALLRTPILRKAHKTQLPVEYEILTDDLDPVCQWVPVE